MDTTFFMKSPPYSIKAALSAGRPGYGKSMRAFQGARQRRKKTKQHGYVGRYRSGRSVDAGKYARGR
jgi:hypothetical protein